MATVIKLKDNRIIFNGHADSLQDCQLVTAVCDSLAESENFRTVKYESGYAEFEKISGGKSAMFPIHGIVSIQSNDGGTGVASFQTVNDRVCTLAITDSGLSFKSLYNGVIENKSSAEWTYNGSKKFFGLSKTSGAIEPDTGLAVGDNYAFENMEDITFYIVEGEASSTGVTFDLSTLGLSAGTYNITVKARADGYADSEVSNAVIYTVDSAQPTVSGVWVFNDTPSVENVYLQQYVNFKYGTGDGYSYDAYGFTITTKPEYGSALYVIENDGEYYDHLIYSSKYDVWYPGAALEVDFGSTEQTISREFYDWFTANATKQETNLITFTIEGTTYQAEDGMTWEQWCSSEYNTAGYNADSGGMVLSADVYAVTTIENTFNTGMVSTADAIVAGYAYYHTTGQLGGAD